MIKSSAFSILIGLILTGGLIKAQSGGIAWFDAPTESYVDLGSTDSSNCFSDLQTDDKLSVTMWVKWDDKNASNVGNWANRLTYADSSGNGDNGTFWCQHNNKNDRFEFAVQTTNGRDYIFSSTNPQEGTWYHVAQVYDGSQMRIYVDGIQEGQMAKSGKLNVSNKSKLNMGRWPNAANNHRFFDGALDEISVWDRALSQQEVTDIMNNPESVTGTNYDANGLIGYWDFDDYTVNDKSPCNNDGSGSDSFTSVPSGSDVTRTTSSGDCNDPNNWDNGVPNDTMTAVVEDSMFLTQKTKTKNLILKDSLNDMGDTLVIEGDLVSEGEYIPSGGVLEFNGSTTQVREILAKNPIRTDYVVVDVPSKVTLDSGKLGVKKAVKVAKGTLDVATNKLTLLSDSNGTGRIAELPAGARIEGQIAVQRWISSGNAGWVDMAAPNRDSVTLEEWDDDIYLSGKKTGGFDDGCSWSGSCFWSVKRSDTTGALVDVTSTSTPLENGRGYELFMGDNGGINTMQSDTTVTVKGTIKEPGSFTVNVNDNGWSLVANPFASPVNFDQIGLNNVDPYYYVAAATGSYESYNKSTGNSSHPDVSKIIASSQGFWVKGNGANASISFQQGQKSSASASFSKNGSEQAFSLRMTDGSNGLSSNILLHTDEDSASFQPVPHKATPVWGAPDLYSIDQEGNALRSQLIGSDEEELLIPLKVVPEEQGLYNFEVKGMEEIPYENAFLVDSAHGNEKRLGKGMAQIELSPSDSGSSRLYLKLTDDPVSIVEKEEEHAGPNVRGNGSEIFIKGKGTFRVNILNSQGQKVRSTELVRLDGGEERLSSGLNAGVYFIRLQSPEQSTTEKILLKR